MKLKISILNVVIFLLLLSVLNIASAEPANQENKTGFLEFLKDIELWFFIIGCGVISILVKIVEHAIRINGIQGTDKVKNFTKKESFLEWLLWLLSASIVGFLGYSVGLFQASIQAAVMIGLGWPTVFKQLKDKYGTKTPNQKVVKSGKIWEG